MMLFRKKFGVSLIAFMAACAIVAQPMIANANKVKNNDAVVINQNVKKTSDVNEKIKSDADIDKALDNMFNDEYNPDREANRERETLEDAMWELSDLDD